MGLSPAGKILFLEWREVFRGMGQLLYVWDRVGRKFSKNIRNPIFPDGHFLIADLVYKGALLGVAIVAICSAF